MSLFCNVQSFYLIKAAEYSDLENISQKIHHTADVGMKDCTLVYLQTNMLSFSHSVCDLALHSFISLLGKLTAVFSIKPLYIVIYCLESARSTPHFMQHYEI